MSRTNPLMLLAVIFAVFAALGLPGVAASALLVDVFDGDVMHLFDMAVRMAAGERPHLDFMTPLGALAVWPISALMALGLKAGTAVALAQLSVALFLMIPAWWAGWSRFPGLWAHVFGASVMVLCLALTWGGSEMQLTVSMHYNRWAWALAFVVLAIGMLRPIRAEGLWADVLILGLGMAVLTMIKATFVVALAGPIVVTLVARRAFALLALSVIVAALALGLAVLVLGGEFWLAYAADLLTTARSDWRAYPGLPPLELAAAPVMLPSVLLTLAAVVVLRTGGREAAGLGLLLLLPALIYVTAQNFGNDPVWTWIVALLLLAWRPAPGQRAVAGIETGQALAILATGLFIASAPSFANMATSPIRNVAAGSADDVPMVPGDRRFSDIRMPLEKAHRFDLIRPGDDAGSGMEWAREGAGRDQMPAFMGRRLEDCTIRTGVIAQSRAIAADLTATGLGGGDRAVLHLDLLNLLWLFEPVLPPLQGGASWYYGGVPGLEAADFVTLPRCAIEIGARNAWVEAVNATMAEGGVQLIELRRTPLYTLYEKIAG